MGSLLKTAVARMDGAGLEAGLKPRVGLRTAGRSGEELGMEVRAGPERPT